MKEVPNRFDCCCNVEHVLKIGREFQMQDSWRGAHHDTAKLLCDTIEYLYERLNGPIGNAAAMHAALIEMRDHADKKIGVTCNVSLLAEYGWFVQKINAALAEPPRNCDIHPKRDEASKAFQETVLTERERERAKQYPLAVMDWFIDWLLATQEGGEK